MSTPQPTASPAPAVIVEEKGIDRRPSVVRTVPTLGSLNVEADVASTNFLLAIVTLIILILTAAILNQTLEENEHRINGILESISAPFAKVLAGANKMAGAGSPTQAMFSTAIGLAVIAGVYGLEEPGAGLNNRSLVLFLSYFGAFAITTAAFEGTQFVMSRRYGVDAVVKVFPIGVAVAVAAVTITKITGFQPGLMYGFVAAHSLASSARLTAEQAGKEALFSALALLGACLGAWLLADPLRTFAEDNGQWWAAVPEGIAVGLFVSGLEGLFFQLIPLDFMDGKKLYAWNRPAWLVISLACGFLFWQVLINDDKDTIDAVGSTSTLVALAVVLACLAVTVALWLFFKALGPLEADEPTGTATGGE